MPTRDELVDSILSSPEGLSIADLLARHPGLARRTAQRWIRELMNSGRLSAVGEGRARRYFTTGSPQRSANDRADTFPQFIPISADSRDIIAYIDQPLMARGPVGYQREFLESYLPNQTSYLSKPLQQQLRRMGDTGQTQLPAGTYGRAIHDRLLIDLSWASSHLEGNTYSRLDTRELIEHGRIATGKDAVETQMILNHKAAIELLVDNVDSVGLDRFTLMNLHSALSENLLPNPADEGRLRQHGVEIGRSVYRPLAVPARIEELLDLMLEKANAIEDVFEQSFFIMVHLPYLQPFANVNKRSSRLAANLPLIRANLCPLTFLDVPEDAYRLSMVGIYEMNRVELLRDLYLWAYERSTQEYLVVKQDLVAPDPLRLAWREVIKDTVRSVVTQPERAPLDIIKEDLSRHELENQKKDVEALIIEELRRLHTGVLARYGLRPSDYIAWQSRQKLV